MPRKHAARGGGSAPAGRRPHHGKPPNPGPCVRVCCRTEAELVVEPEEDGSDDDGAGRDEHVRRLVQQYKQQGGEVSG